MSVKAIKKNKITKQKLNGIVYTPEWVVNLILDKLEYKNDIFSKKIVDPACGDGAFLSIVIEKFIKDAKKKKKTSKETAKLLQENIYGFDINNKSVKKCRKNLQKIASLYNIKNIDWKIFNFDSLNKENVSKYFNFFDFVIGNPPYIRIQHLGKTRRERIQKNWSLCESGSTDIYIAFFELGYNLLKTKGKLGYITPNTFLKTKAGELLRYFLKNNKCIRAIIDFEHNQVFDGVTTYSAITILNKNYNQNIFSLYKGKAEKIKYIDKIDVKNLNMDNWVLTSNEILKKVKFLEQKGIPLGKIANIHVGITTLADDYYIFKDPNIKDKKTIIKIKDGRIFEIETEILKPIIKGSILKEANKDQNRYIIFPYKKINGRHIIIPERELMKSYSLAYKYFLSIKDVLLSRDKKKPNPVSWYAFGRSQGLDTSFGRKIITSPINLKPNFIVWEKEEYTFYAGYCIKFNGDLRLLADKLNSREMEFYINYTSRDYQNSYKSYSKSFIEKFCLDSRELLNFKGAQSMLPI